MKKLLLVSAVLLALVACEQKKAPAPIAAPAPAVVPAPAAADAVTPTASDKK